MPYIDGLSEMSFEGLDLALETGGTKFSVAEVNWPDEYPYAPDCNCAIARDRESLALRFHVRGLDIRAVSMEDNGRSWEDSCCEFFVEHPSDGTYYNFELTCAGSLLCAKRASRTDKKEIPNDVLANIKRFSTLERKPIEEAGKIFEWTVILLVPFALIGVDKDNLPEKLRGNFYKCGDLTAHPHFASWSPIQTPKPDFHRPEFFGDLILEKR